jgi:hypothetical protein
LSFQFSSFEDELTTTGPAFLLAFGIWIFFESKFPGKNASQAYIVVGPRLSSNTFEGPKLCWSILLE